MSLPEELVKIHRYLPHRAPMLMVDYIIEQDDSKVRTSFEIKEDNLFIKNDVLTEPGLIENIAQSCSAVVAKSYFIDKDDNVIKGVTINAFISSIKKLTVHSLPKLGDTIIAVGVLGTRFDADGYSICSIDCKSYQKDTLLLEADIVMFIQQN